MVTRVPGVCPLFHQLKPILLDHRHHTLPQRLHLYDVGVLSSLNYGIKVIGLSRKGSLQYHSLILGHWRAIARSPRHITRESNAALALRLQRQLPILAFASLHRTWRGQLLLRQEEATPHDVIRHVPIPAPWSIDPALRTHDTELGDAATQPALDASLQVESACLACPTCSRGFKDMSALKIHCTKLGHSFPDNLQFTRRFDMARDALEGLPQCKHCCAPFAVWRTLKDHINLGRCPELSKITNDQEVAVEGCPVAQKPQVVYLVQARSFSSLLNDRTLLYTITHVCVICCRWCASNVSLSNHYQRNHLDIHKAASTHQPMIRAHAALLDNARQCSLCLSVVKNIKRHKCSVIQQMAVLHEVINVKPSSLLSNSAANAEQTAPHKCDICGTTCKTALGLRQHKARARNCKPPVTQVTQKHCCTIGDCIRSYSSLKALKRHQHSAHGHLAQTSHIMPHGNRTLDQFFLGKTQLRDSQRPRRHCDIPKSLLELVEAEVRCHSHLLWRLDWIYAVLRPSLDQEPVLHKLLGMKYTNGHPPMKFLHHHATEMKLRQLLLCTHTCEPNTWLLLLHNFYCIIGRDCAFHICLECVARPCLLSRKLADDSRGCLGSADPWLTLLLLEPHFFHHGWPKLRTRRDGRHEPSLSGFVGQTSSFADAVHRQTQKCPGAALCSRRVARHIASRSGKTYTPPGTDALCSFFGLCHDDFHRNGGRISSAIFGRHSPAVEKGACCRHGESAIEASPSHHDDEGAQITNLTGPRQCSIRQHPTSAPQKGLSHREWQLGLPHLGSCRQVPSTQRRRSTYSCPAGRSSQNSDRLHGAPGHHQISKSEVASEPTGASHSVEAHDHLAASSWQCALRGDAEAGPKRQHPTHLDERETSHRRSITTDDKGGPTSSHTNGQEPGQREILLRLKYQLQQAQLTNRNAWCWLNSLYLSFGIMWVDWALDGAPPAPIPVCFTDLLLGKTSHVLCLPRHLDLTLFENSLADACQAQQDVGEGLDAWLSIVNSSTYDSSWLLRSNLGVLDSGGHLSPLQLHLPRSAVRKRGLQSLIRNWSNDTRGRQALVHVPQHICLQILRFHHTYARREDMIFWDRHRVVTLPIFSNVHRSEVKWRSYMLRSGIIHQGDSAHSGHYRAVYFDKNGSIHAWNDYKAMAEIGDEEFIQRHLCYFWLSLIQTS